MDDECLPLCYAALTSKDWATYNTVLGELKTKANGKLLKLTGSKPHLWKFIKVIREEESRLKLKLERMKDPDYKYSGRRKDAILNDLKTLKIVIMMLYINKKSSD